MGPDGVRPPGEAFYYETAYLIGCICLVGFSWVILRFLKRSRFRSIVYVGAASIAILAALALRVEYRVYRAESCFRWIQKIQKDPTREHRGQLRDNDGLFVSVMPDYDNLYGPGGTNEIAATPIPAKVATTYGDPVALCRFLRYSYSHWFSAAVIRSRNMLLGTASPSENEIAALESARMTWEP